MEEGEEGKLLPKEEIEYVICKVILWLRYCIQNCNLTIDHASGMQDVKNYVHDTEKDGRKQWLHWAEHDSPSWSMKMMAKCFHTLHTFSATPRVCRSASRHDLWYLPPSIHPGSRCKLPLLSFQTLFLNKWNPVCPFRNSWQDRIQMKLKQWWFYHYNVSKDQWCVLYRLRMYPKQIAQKVYATAGFKFLLFTSIKVRLNLPLSCWVPAPHLYRHKVINFMNCDLEELDHSHIITTTNFMLLHSDSLKRIEMGGFCLFR